MKKMSDALGAAVHAVIFDCDDPMVLAEFYANLLGGEVEADPFGGYSVTVAGLGCTLGFQADEDYQRPVWPGEKGGQMQMMHLDLRVRDRQEAVEYALAIGATEPAEQFCQPDWEPQWITLLDPAGHPFCIWDE